MTTASKITLVRVFMIDLRMEKNWMRLPRDCARQLQAARKAWKSMRIRLKG